MKMRYLYSYDELPSFDWKLMERNLTDVFSPSDELGTDIDISTLTDHSNSVNPTDLGAEDETKNYLKSVVRKAKKNINGNRRRDDVLQNEDNS